MLLLNFFIKNGFLKKTFTPNDIFQVWVIKKFTSFIKQDPQEIFKSSNLKPVLAICRILQLMEIDKLIY